MRKRDKARQWLFRAEHQYGANLLVGNNKIKTQRLTNVRIGEWLNVELIPASNTNNKREQYRVLFGDDVYVVSIMDDGHPSINLAWAKSLVDANPMNVGKLNR